MEKLLRPKDKILLGLSVLGDLYFEIAEPLSIQIGKMKGSLPSNYKATNFYATVNRSLYTGEIEKVIKNGQVYYSLTNIGRKRVKRYFPLLKLQGQKWDGLWRVVIFDIKEKEKAVRNRLRNKLKSLGFGQWQKSVYLSPFNVAYDLTQYLAKTGLTDQVCVLVAKHLFSGEVNKLVSKIWPLILINNQYRKLIEDWQQAKQQYQKEKLKRAARDCYSQYLEIITQDPFLPTELLPADWYGNGIKKYLQEWLGYL